MIEKQYKKGVYRTLDIEATLDVIIAHLNKVEEKGEEVSEDEGGYYYVSGNGDVFFSHIFNGVLHQKRLTFGNCFRTEAEALAARDKIKEILK
jgi:hypothetical protein